MVWKRPCISCSFITKIFVELIKISAVYIWPIFFDRISFFLTQVLKEAYIVNFTFGIFIKDNSRLWLIYTGSEMWIIILRKSLFADICNESDLNKISNIWVIHVLMKDIFNDCYTRIHAHSGMWLLILIFFPTMLNQIKTQPDNLC